MDARYFHYCDCTVPGPRSQPNLGRGTVSENGSHKRAATRCGLALRF